MRNAFFSTVLSIVVFALMIVLFEVIFSRLAPVPLVTRYQNKFVNKLHPEVGYCLNDDGEYWSVLRRHTGECTFVTTTIKDGIRFTPSTGPLEKKRFACFFGDSYTFGKDCPDDHTLPYYFGENRPEYRPYNFGIAGGSVQNMYYILSNTDLRKQVREEQGIAVYWFLGFHTERVVGGMPSFNGWADITACYEEFGNDIKYLGTFRDAHPWRSLLYDSLHSSSTMRYFGINLPFRYSEKDYALAARLLIESERLFIEKFPGSEFLVLFWDDTIPYASVKKRVENAGIRTLVLDSFLWQASRMGEVSHVKKTLDGAHFNDYRAVAEGLASIIP